MAIIMMSPGVEVTIRDFSDYTSAVSSTYIGIVGGARKGPTGPTLVTTKAEAIEIFGLPTKRDYGMFALLAALDNSSSVYYNRVVKRPSRSATKITNQIVFATKEFSGTFNGSKVEFKASEWGTPWLKGELDNPSEPEKFPDSDENIERYGVNLVQVDEEGTDAQKSAYFDVIITNLDGTMEVIDYCTKDTIAHRFDNDSLNFLALINNDIEATPINLTNTLVFSGGATGCKFAQTEARDDINFVSANYDSTMDGWKVKISKKSFINTFTYELWDAQSQLRETFTELNLDPTDERYIEDYINNNSRFILCSYDRSIDSDITDQEYVFTNGADGIEGLTEDEIIAGLDDFSNPEVIENDVLLAPGWSSPNVIDKGISVCEGRQDSLFLIDPPFGLTPSQVVDWSNNQGNYNRSYASALNSSYGAVYWPWVQSYDVYTRSYVWLPPSAHVASQMAYSESVSESWFAPAGLNRGILNNIVGIEMSPTNSERNLLYGKSNCINPITNFKQYGIAIWGQKTTQRRPTALNRVNVRRLVNYIKRLITNASYYYIFDPNDSYLWSKWQGRIDSLLSIVKSKRGLYDYRVIMDGNTVTVDDIENNRMPGKVLIKPTKTAEFLPIDFMILPYAASFDNY